MAEVRLLRIRLRPGTEERLGAWVRTLREREAEVRETLRAEGVTVESVFLDRGADGALHLLYYLRAESLAEAERVFAASDLPIDAYHRAFKAEAFGRAEPLPLLLDFTADAEG